MPDLMRRLWRHLEPGHRAEFFLLLGLMMLNALAEVISLGAVLPFLGILTAPERVMAWEWMQPVMGALGIHTAAGLVLPLTFLFVLAIVIAAFLRMLLLWWTTRYTLRAGLALSCLTYRRTLYQPYSVHIARNSSGVISGLTNKINTVVFGVVMPLLVLASSALLVVSVVATLMVIDPVVAMTAALALGLGYGTITLFTRHRMRRNSENIAHGQTGLLKTLQDGLGGIRDVLLDGTQDVYCGVYREADEPLRRAQCNNTFISQSPRIVMEAAGMLLIAGIAYAMSRQAGGITPALPVLGALALGAQRMLPALQQAYSAWQSIAGNRASLQDVVDLLDQPLPEELLLPAPQPLEFDDGIVIEDVSYRYDTGPWILDGINLRVPKGARVGLVGPTGSGKSTLLDILMGLLPPTRGRLLVDGNPLGVGQTLRAWQGAIAHVPQSIYLADASIAENIAFGVPAEDIDRARVGKAAHAAQIGDFIESSAGGYDATVGERGIRLSGGQRQRIGIARALYKDASVLVFDEATSALDTATEQSVMETIASLDRGLTVFLIAHRLSTVRGCDMIVELNAGRIVAVDTYDNLVARSPSFRRMAGESG
ncbi:ABC transporter ATP-binding protein [Luteimonas vadosa]|uniref:ABC transporter ATP-binding protein n=1 Tax=Luteimonas vadosa TaxID=1165507 RepID=A0ABP9DSP6_9GAMM